MSAHPPISDSHAQALEYRKSWHLGDQVAKLSAAVASLEVAVAHLQKIERRLNWPLLSLTFGILLVLVYIAHRIP